MRSRHIRPWVPLTLTSLFLGTLARECVLEDQFLDSSEEVHEALAGCTTVIADKLSIGGASGRLVLPDVVNITGAIHSTALVPLTLSSPLMTSIEAPQLVHLGGLDLNRIGSIANLSFPKLQHVAGQIRIEGLEQYVNIDFPVLENVKSIYLDGDFGRLGFRRLQSVDNDLIVINCEGCKTGNFNPTTSDPVAIMFPALESVGFIKLAGVISSISLPRLVSAGPPMTLDEPEPDLHTRPNSSDSGIRLHMTEMSSPYELQLPSLSSVDKQLYIHGEIKNLSVPALQYTEGSVHIDASRPLRVSLPLVSASSITLRGKIKSVHLPSLGPDTRLTLESTYECGQYTPSPSPSASYDLECTVGGNNLNKDGKIGLGFGMAVGVMLFAGIGLLVCRKRAIKRKTPMPVIEQEMSTLPVAATRAENHLQAQARPETPPPPYSSSSP